MLSFLCKHLEQCCYWYSIIPGNNSECTIAPGLTAFLKCGVYVPRDVNNNPVGRVRWYRSLNLVTSEDVTDEHDVQINSASLPANSTGLFRDTYSLIIRNITSQNNGYYLCQIITNETCLSRSPYVNISVSTASTSTESPPCPSFDYGENPVCATTVKASIMSTEDKSLCLTPTSLYRTSVNSAVIPSTQPARTGFCMTELDTRHLEFIACLGVTVPTAGFVLILIILFICCAGIYVCRRKKLRKGKQKFRVFFIIIM